MTGRENTYGDAEISSRLSAELPKWTYSAGHIRRRFRTHNWKGTLMAINAIGHLAEVAWHHPEIAASYDWVEVALMTHSANGITDKDFTLAEKIEAVVAWRPAQEGGPLTGIPEGSPQFGYIKHDD